MTKNRSKMAYFALKPNLLTNYSVNYLQIPGNEWTSWPPSTVKTPFRLNGPKLVKMTEHRLKNGLDCTQSQFSLKLFCQFTSNFRKMNDHHDLLLQWKQHFDWIVLSWSKWPKIGRKMTKVAILRTLVQFSQKLFSNFFSYFRKWKPIMPSLHSPNAIFLELL